MVQSPTVAKVSYRPIDIHTLGQPNIDDNDPVTAGFHSYQRDIAGDRNAVGTK